MRTTLTLDDDVARLLNDAVYRERRPMKQVVNDALRSALRSAERDREPYRLRSHTSGLRAGIDPAGFNRLTAEHADDAALPALGSGDAALPAFGSGGAERPAATSGPEPGENSHRMSA